MRLPQSGKRTIRKGFTLLELVVVFGIIGVLAALTLSAVLKARVAARDTMCMNNLREIGLALRQFGESNGDKMPTALRPGLNAYLSDTEAVWKCPFDEREGTVDSYSEFYMPCDVPEFSQIMLRCPRHPQGEGWINLRADRSVDRENQNSILPEGILHSYCAKTMLPNDCVLESGSNFMILLASREGSLNNWHIVIGLQPQPNQPAEATFTVKGGTKFEVITPAGVAKALGTKFTVKATKTTLGEFSTFVKVSEGTVSFGTWHDQSGKILKKTTPPGQSTFKLKGSDWPFNIHQGGSSNGTGNSGNGNGNNGNGNGNNVNGSGSI